MSRTNPDRAPAIRVGRIAYVNVAPVYHPLEAGWLEHPFVFQPGVPARCNELLRQGELDLASVSSIEYARDPDRYLLLPDLAIASDGPVGSVLLLSRLPLDELAHSAAGHVLATSATHTSAALLHLLFLDQCGRCPPFVPASGGVREALESRDPRSLPPAVLTIGDEALRLAGDPRFPHVFDLGEMWKTWTGLPFVFGLWAARRDWAEAHPELASQGAALLRASRDLGLERLEAVMAAIHPQAGIPLPALRDYFAGLRLRLGEGERRGLEMFRRMLREAGLLHGAPRLEFLSEPASGARRVAA